MRPNDGPIAGSQSTSAQTLQAVRSDVVEQAAVLKAIDGRVERLAEIVGSLDTRNQAEIGAMQGALGDLQDSLGGLGERQGSEAASLALRLDALQDVLSRIAAFETLRAELDGAREEITALRTARKTDLIRIHSLAEDRDALESEIQANAARHRQELSQYRAPRPAPAMPPVASVEAAPRAAKATETTPAQAPADAQVVRRLTGKTPMPVLTRQGALDPAHAQALLDPAKAAMRARNWGAAAEAYATFLSYQSAKPGPWKQFGHAIKEMGDLGGAEHAYYRALALDASDVDTAIHLGHVLKNQDLRDQAAEVFAAALQMDPQSQAARDGLESMGCPLPDIQKMSRVKTPRIPFFKRYLFNKELAKAKRAARSRNWQAAADLYGKVLESTPANTRLLIQRGHSFKELGQLDRAEALYREALALEPLNSDAYLHVGHARKLQGDAEGARASYLRAVRYNPDNQDALDEL